MSFKKTQIEYKLSDEDKPIVLSYFVGFGQTGLTSLHLDSARMECDSSEHVCHEGDYVNKIQSKVIGSSSSLKLSTLEIDTFIKDVSDATDRTSVTIELSGGAEFTKATLEQTAPTNGSVQYTTSIIFVP